MNFEHKLERIVNLSQIICGQEPLPSTIPEEQAAIAMATISGCVIDLLAEGMPVQVVEHSLFYFWLHLEASLRRVSEEQVNQQFLANTAEQIVTIIKKVIDNLPDYSPTLEMQRLGKEINGLKSYLTGKDLSHLSENELALVVENVNTRIHKVSSHLLMQSVHPGIIANVLFSYWLRTSTIQSYVPEKYYQKMEFYFCEIIEEVRKQIPLIFATKAGQI